MDYSEKTISLRERMASYVAELRNRICEACEEIDGGAKFRKDTWERPGGGGGLSGVIENGNVFEKGGVNFSAVHGELPEAIAKKMDIENAEFYATGVSLVLHPYSPKVPTVHANFRYFEQSNGDAWFGGGADLTPYSPQAEDAIHFHNTFKQACNPFGAETYQKYKNWCDEYFYIKHRKEARGLGGIFFDYLRGNPQEMETHFQFVQSCGNAFLNSYLPIVQKRKEEKFSEREKKFQLLRRGRYVEFNLIYDRGTTFGLETEGRIESILMSLPPVVNYDYNPDMTSTQDEILLTEWLKNPKDWA